MGAHGDRRPGPLGPNRSRRMSAVFSTAAGGGL